MTKSKYFKLKTVELLWASEAYGECFCPPVCYRFGYGDGEFGSFDGSVDTTIFVISFPVILRIITVWLSDARGGSNTKSMTANLKLSSRT